MKGTDWLRRKAAAAIRISDARPTADIPQHTVVEIELRTPSAFDLAQIAERIQMRSQAEHYVAESQRTKAAADRASYCQQRGWLDCNCVVIYSRCYYGH